MHVAPIDLQPFREGTDADRRAVAAEFDAAGRDSGFFAVTGHGVDRALLDEMLAVTAGFFDLPVEEKMACYVEDRTANRGYAPEGTEALAYSLGGGTTRCNVERQRSFVHSASRSPRLTRNPPSGGSTSCHAPPSSRICRPGTGSASSTVMLP